jgi:tetratricopeptide (TPR) repeat protein
MRLSRTMAENFRIDELRRRVQMDPASIAFAALAEEYRRVGRYDDAVATCRAGLQRHPAYLSARVTLGRALLEMGRYDDARVELEHVLRISPENLAAIRGLAELHRKRNDQATSADESDATSASLSEETVQPSAPPPLPFRRSQVEQRPESVQARKPEERAVAALESFLAAILRARTSVGTTIPTASGQ